MLNITTVYIYFVFQYLRNTSSYLRHKLVQLIKKQTFCIKYTRVIGVFKWLKPDQVANGISQCLFVTHIKPNHSTPYWFYCQYTCSIITPMQAKWEIYWDYIMYLKQHIKTTNAAVYILHNIRVLLNFNLVSTLHLQEHWQSLCTQSWYSWHENKYSKQQI